MTAVNIRMAGGGEIILSSTINSSGESIAEMREKMKLNIVCIPGDGIGPEIVAEARKVLDKTAKVYGHEIIYTDVLMGGASIDAYGVPLTQETIDTAKGADAVLMGSIGGDTTTSPWYKLAP